MMRFLSVNELIECVYKKFLKKTFYTHTRLIHSRATRTHAHAHPNRCHAPTAAVCASGCAFF